MIRLGVNIDHVATLRQARRAVEPDPVAAAVLALLGGADGITIHLREDRRHIQDRDLHALRPIVTNRLNLEMAAVDAIADIACEVKPDEATLVPEKRQELTTEGGLDVIAHEKAVERIVKRLRAAGIEVSLFLDPRYHLPWSSRVIPLVLLAAILTSKYWVPGSSIYILGDWLLVKLVDLLLAFLLFKWLGHEARRYRQSSPDLPPNLRL